MLDDLRTARHYFVQPKKTKWNHHLEAAFRARLAGRHGEKTGMTICSELFQKWNAVFHAYQNELGHEPIRNHSIGMFAITVAADILEAKEILLVGFDNLLNPVRGDYFKANKGKWRTDHDWFAERAMLPAIEKMSNVEIKAWV